MKNLNVTQIINFVRYSETVENQIQTEAKAKNKNQEWVETERAIRGIA
jgi:hypothetical protein